MGRSLADLLDAQEKRGGGHDRVGAGVCGDLNDHSATDGWYHPLLCLRVHRHASPGHQVGPQGSGPSLLNESNDDTPTINDTIRIRFVRQSGRRF